MAIRLSTRFAGTIGALGANGTYRHALAYGTDAVGETATFTPAPLGPRPRARAAIAATTQPVADQFVVFRHLTASPPLVHQSSKPRARLFSERSPRIELRALAQTDAAELLALRRRNRQYFQPTEPLRDDDWFTLERQRREIDAETQSRTAGSSLSFGVFADGALVGRVALAGILRGAFRNAYLGYAIDEAHAGRGIGTATVRQAVRIAWEAELHRVQAAVSPDNLASQRVLEKVGFRREGLAKRYLLLAGHWSDQQLWAITTEDELTT